MYKRILVPTDGSETAGLGLREAIGLAKKLEARVRLLYVLNKLPWVSTDISESMMVQQLVDELRGNGESILHEATRAVRDAGLEADSRLIEALGTEAGESIVAEAASWPAELIVCGTHGRRGVRRLLMGSDAEYVVRHSPVPVLLVRAPS